ncbi:hypothetical protein SMATCC274_30410 [Serratia marcescens]|nr:hypothetical protein SMATCC274_30410 [Serratia marcescens]
MPHRQLDKAVNVVEFDVELVRFKSPVVGKRQINQAVTDIIGNLVTAEGQHKLRRQDGTNPSHHIHHR